MHQKIILDGHFRLVQLQFIDGLIVVDDEEHYYINHKQMKEGDVRAGSWVGLWVCKVIIMGFRWKLQMFLMRFPIL